MAFACYVRLENFFIFSAVILFSYAVLSHSRRDFKKIIIPALIFIALLPPVFYLVSSGPKTFGPYPEQVPQDFNWEYYKEPFSVKYLPENISLLTEKFSNPLRYPILLYPFVLLSIIYLLKWPKTIVPLLWLIFSVLFFGRFWALRFVNPELYLSSIQPAISVLYGIGVMAVYYFLDNKLMAGRKILKYAVLSVFVLLTISVPALVLSKIDYDSNCFTKDIYNAGNILNGCIIAETTNGVSDLTKVVKFILPNKEILNDTKFCNEGYLITVIDPRFRGIFGEVSNKTVLDGCLTQNLTENFRGVDIYKFSCG
jgi:hypothetical protein